MKSQIIYQDSKTKHSRGFLMIEIMLAFSLFIIFTISAFVLITSMQDLKMWSKNRLEVIRLASLHMDQGLLNKFSDMTNFISKNYGSDTRIISNNIFSTAYSDYSEAWGRSSCDVGLNFDSNNTEYFSSGIGGAGIGTANLSTDLEARGRYVYLTADSTISSKHDFFIINYNNPQSPNIISSLNTGPGLSGIEVAGPNAFLAQASSVNQLQIIDIHDRSSPILISQLRLPLPTPTTTAPYATSIFYSRGYVYIGTEKWEGAEFSIIDVSNVQSPYVIGNFETNTLINDIYVRGDRAYLASSDQKQLRVLDIKNKSNPVLIDSFSSTGWQTQQGRTLDYFEGSLAFGRTVGGFNVISNHEAFIFGSSSISRLAPETFSDYASRDIPGGVYGMLLRPPFVYILSHLSDKEFQVLDTELSKIIFEMPLGKQNIKMSCDRSTIYFVTGDSNAVSALKLND